MIFHRNRRCFRRRFSLIEVMIVLIILASLAALVMPAVMKNLDDAKRRNARIQLGALASACKDYYFDLSEYPKRLEDLIQDPGNDSWNGPYLDPPSIPVDPWKTDYQYTAPGQENRPFEIVSLGADKSPGGEKKNADIHHWDIDN